METNLIATIRIGRRKLCSVSPFTGLLNHRPTALRL